MESRIIDFSKAITKEDKMLEQEFKVRSKRNLDLSKSDWMVLRHQDETALGINRTLSDEEYKNLLEYRNSLRNITSAEGWAT